MPGAEEREVTFDDQQPGVFHEEGAEQGRSRMGEILEHLEDPEFTDLEMINRLIAVEIALTLADSRLKFTPRAVSDKVKALRELTRTLQEGDNLAKKDFLNFDGPKFKYVLQEMVSLFRASLKNAGLPEDAVNHVLRIFRDSLVMRMPELIKETERVTHESLFMQIDTPSQGN